MVVAPIVPNCPVIEDTLPPTNELTVAFVAPNVPICPVKEEMEFVLSWAMNAAPEDKLITFTAGVLIALIDMLPVDRLSAFIWLTLATDAVKVPVCELKEDTLLAVKLLTVAFVAVSCPVCSLSEETLPATMLLVLIPRAPNTPTWAVKEEMELPVYWLIEPTPEDILITFTRGVLIALINMLPVDRLSAFIWSTLATDAIKVPVCEVKEDTLMDVKLLTVAFVAVSCPVCSLSDETLTATMLLVLIPRAPNTPTWAVKEEIELPVY